MYNYVIDWPPVVYLDLYVSFFIKFFMNKASAPQSIYLLTYVHMWEQCNHTRKTELNRYLVHALEQTPICTFFFFFLNNI